MIHPLAHLAEKQQHLRQWVLLTLPSFVKIHQAVLEKKSNIWKLFSGQTADDDDDDDG